jgi:hypothetical protein
VTLVALRDRDHEPQVRVDHPLLGGVVATLHALRERDLLGGGQQRVAAGAVHEQRQRIGRADDSIGLPDVGRLDGCLVLIVRSVDLDVAGLELSAKRPEVILLEVVLERERLQGALLDLPSVLALVEERLKRCFKHGAQFFSLPSIVVMRVCGAVTALPHI